MNTDSVRDLLQQRGNRQGDRARANLGQVKLETFSGDRSQYRNWMKTIQAQKQLYQIQDNELAVLMFLSTTGEAREVLNQLEVTDMQQEGGLQRILRLLEEAYGSKADERFEERQSAFLNFRRLPGQSIAAYLATLKRLRTEYLREDTGTVISDRAFAQRMLTRAALTRKERYDCFFAAGGTYRSGPIEKVLRFRCAQIHIDEHPSSRRQDDRAGRAVQRQPQKRRTYKRSDRRGPYRPTRHTHVVGDHPEDELDYDDDEGYGDTDDEDFEQEALMAEEDMPEEEGWSQEEFDDEEVDEIDQQALQEAFAAGWKAKNKTAAAKQARGYKGDGKPSKGKGKGKRPDSRNPEDRKRNSTCASCGQRGHWRGDSVCPNVRSGKDPPHRKENSTHFTTGRSDRGSASAATGSAREHSRDDREPLQRKPHPSGLKSTGKAAPPDPPHRGAIDKSPAETFVVPRGPRQPPPPRREPREPDHPPPERRQPPGSPPRREREPEKEPKAENSPEKPKPKRRRRSTGEDRSRRSTGGDQDKDRDRGRRRRRQEEEHAAEEHAAAAETETTRAAAPHEEAFVSQPSSGVTTRQCNWTLMVGGWDVLREYNSEGEDTVSSHTASSDSEIDEYIKNYQLHDLPATKKVNKEKLKVKLLTVLRSLADDEEDTEVKKRLKRKEKRLQEKTTEKVTRSQASGSEAPQRSRAKKETRDPKLDEDMGLSTEDLLRLLPSMSKEEKKILYRQLKKEREDEAEKLFGKNAASSTPAMMKRPDRRRDGYSAASVPSGSTGRGLRKEDVQEPPDLEATMPIGVRKKRMNKFRQELYEAAKNRKGRVVPSEASDLPTAEQENCPHPFERLLWGANSNAQWANCRDCKLRKVLYYSAMHGAMAVDQPMPDILEEDNGAYHSNILAPGHVILDTGCRTAVAGRKWHNNLQELMRQKGMPFYKAYHEEVFRFGAGAPVLSTEAFIYAIQIYDHKSWVRIAVVDNTPEDGRVAECPGLVGPAELARWKVQIDFAKLQVGIHGKWRPTVLSPSRHPILNLLNVDKRPDPGQWEVGELKELRQRLSADPHSFALLQEALDELSSDTGSAGDEASRYEAVHWTAQQLESMAKYQQNTESEAINLLDVIGPECFRVTTGGERDDSSTGSISERESETSHEGGLPMVLDSSSEESTSSGEELMADDVMMAGGAGDTEHLTKGQKRRLLSATKHVSEAVEVECDRRRKEKEVPRFRPLKTGLKIMEIFTWSCMLSRFAYGLGWEYLEPVTLPGWDLTNPRTQMEAHQYIDSQDPDFVMLAWPCGPWSLLQNLNGKTWTQREALQHKREESRKLLKFSAQVALKRQKRGRATLGENPLTSLAWNEEPIIDGFGDFPEGICDQCQYGLKHPENKMPLKKATRFVGQEEIVAELRKRCPGNHEHFPIEGSVRTKDGTISLSSWAGGYPIPLCRAIMTGVINYIHRPEDKQVYVFDDHVAEESYQDGMDAIREEEDQITEELAEPEEDERRAVPREVQKAVEFAHRQLGHPSRDTLVRMLRISGATEEAIRHARRWRCEVCSQRQPPKHPMAATPTLRPYGFNRKIHIDIKFVFDSRGRKYPCLSAVDLGTTYHMAVLLKTRRSDYVAGKFLRHWVQVFGVPEHITHDQGGEFELSFIQLLEEMAVPSTVTGAHAGWQLSVGERHGSILGNMISAITAEHNSEGFNAMKLVISSAVAAKNMTVTKDGFTPNQRLYGSEIKFPSLTEDNAKPSFAEALDAESEYARAHRMRICARLALIRMDVQEKLRRTILRKPAHEGEGPFSPGTQIYFWTPKKADKRYKRGGLWRGPATILTRENKERYFASWRGRALLLAAPNIRLATKEELALREPAKEDADDLGELLRDPHREKTYKDQTRLKPPPRVVKRKAQPDTPERKRARMLLRGTKSIRQILQDRSNFLKQFQKRKAEKQIEDQPEPKRAPRAKRPKALKDAQAAPEISPSLPPPDPPAGEEDDVALSEPYTPGTPMDDGEPPHIATDDEGLDEPSAAEAEPPTVKAPHEVPVPPMDESEWEAEFIKKLPGEERRRLALDDVPLSLKRRHERVDDAEADQAIKKLRANFCAQVAATTVFGTLQNEWVSRYEVELLKQLTGLPVTAARIHRSPRKRFQRPPKMISRSRLSILIGKNPEDTFIVNETEEEVRHNPRRRSSFYWKGMTIFYKTYKEDETEPVYIQLPDGLYKADFKTHEAQEFESLWAEEVKDLLTSEALILKLKKCGKELDPAYFDEKEQAAFDISDKKEWSEWIKNGVVQRVTPEEAEKIPRANIFRAPLRMLRTNKQSNRLLPLVAKSRLIVPGHLDPQLGEFRTDSPTCPQAAVRSAKAVASARGWGGTTFDVTTAFLSGKSLQRKVYIRAPREGLPSVEKWPPIQPGELLQILKSAYGLTESPRLWYLEALDRMKNTDLQELEICKSCFVASGQDGRSYAILCLHVDDGLLLGDLKDRRVQRLKEQINSMFTIKAWKELSADTPLQFLGVDVTQDARGICDDMSQYIKQINIEPLQGNGDLGPREVTLYRQLVMRLRWPAQQVLPHLLYQVSNLAQRVNKATYADYREAVKLHGQFLEEAAQGRAQLVYPKLNEKDKLFYVSYFDASVGREQDGKSQLGAVHFLTTEQARRGPAPASVIEFTTNKSGRVLRSSMSAESCSMSGCVDRHLYGRLVIDRLLLGNRPLDANWRTTMGLTGGVVTDAKSLFDHLSTTGQLPTERQTMLDLMVSRHHLESGAYELFWVPTHRQFADCLTKKMVCLLWQGFCRVPRISLRETPEEKALEDHRRKLRQGQRQRRKAKMKGCVPQPAAPGTNYATHQHTFLAM